MNDYTNLRALAANAAMARVTVDRMDIAELLAEVDALRTSGAKPASKYSAEFEEAWTLYPSRPGNSKAAAFKAWAARLKAGATALEMIDGTAKYAAYVKAERTEAHYIKQAATFYGPGEHFSADWTVRRSAEPAGRGRLSVADQNAFNNAEALRLMGQPTFYDDGMTIEATHD